MSSDRITPQDIAWVPFCADDNERCDAQHEIGYECTRFARHLGKHAAHGVGNDIVFQWDQDDPTPEQTTPATPAPETTMTTTRTPSIETLLPENLGRQVAAALEKPLDERTRSDIEYQATVLARAIVALHRKTGSYIEGLGDETPYGTIARLGGNVGASGTLSAIAHEVETAAAVLDTTLRMATR